MDRPARGERRRRAVPLGLHADGRSRRPRCARRAACCARAGASRSRCGTRSSATRGRCCRPRAASSAASREPPAPGDAGPVRARRSPSACASCSRRPASPRSRSTRSTSLRRHAELRGVLGDDARPLAQLPRRRARRARGRDRARSEAALAARFAPYTARRRLARRCPVAHARRARASACRAYAARRIACRAMIYDDDADLTCSTARPSRSSATARRATRTR